jgi:hypothetical protein
VPFGGSEVADDLPRWNRAGATVLPAAAVTAAERAPLQP